MKGLKALKYLKENKKEIYTILRVNNRLKEHLIYINNEAEKKVKIIINEMCKIEKVDEKLKENNQTVIIGPTLGNKSKYELKEKSFVSGKVLHENGVNFAIMTDHPVIEQKHTLIHAALFVKAGLPELEALKAVTINAAKTCYVDHLVGSIKEGKHADIVIWSKHPLDIMSEAETVILNGNIEK